MYRYFRDDYLIESSIRTSNLEEFIKLIEARPEKKISKNHLYHICKYEALDILNCVFEKGYISIEVLNERDTLGKTVLDVACHEKKIELVRVMLKDKRMKLGSGELNFEYCCFKLQIEMVMLFLQERKEQLKERQVELGNFVLYCSKRANDSNEIQIEEINEFRKKLKVNEMFFIACASNDVSLVKYLILNQAIDVNFQVPWIKETALYRACEKNLIDITSILLEQPQTNLNLQNSTEFTPLFIACENEHVKIVKLLVMDKRTDFQEALCHGRTLLHFACGHDDLELVEFLLKDKRIDLNKRNFEGNTGFFIACKKGNLDIVNLLLNTKSIDYIQRNNYGMTPFYISCAENNIQVVQTLLDNPNVEPFKSLFGFVPFHAACQKNNLEIVKLLLKDPRLDINEKNALRQTGFFFACSFGSFDVIKLLLDIPEVDINFNNVHRDMTPLNLVSSKGFFYIVQYMINHPRINVSLKDGGGNSPLHSACRQKNIDIVKLLLNDSRFDPFSENNSNETPIFNACVNRHVNIIELLLTLPQVDVNKRNSNGETIFYLACSNGDMETVELLLKDGKVDINVATNEDKTPFWISCYYGYLELAKKLIERGANMLIQIKTGENALHAAIHWNKIEIVKFLLSQDPRIKEILVTQETTKGIDPFSLACQKNSQEIINELVKENKINYHRVNEKGETVFFLACFRNERLARFLIDHRLDSQIPNNEGITPLQICCQQRQDELVKLIIASSRKRRLDPDNVQKCIELTQKEIIKLENVRSSVAKLDSIVNALHFYSLAPQNAISDFQFEANILGKIFIYLQEFTFFFCS